VLIALVAIASVRNIATPIEIAFNKAATDLAMTAWWGIS
jgi:Flp pilus assembly pilin Flp